MKHTLYKKDSKGKLRILEIEAVGDTVVQKSGLIGGKITPTISQCVGKNIGRANETTPEEQAILEAQSKYTDKLTKGYFPTEDEAKNNVVVLPMLAKDAKKEMKKVIFPCYVQPKLDGMRSLGNVMGMMSRTGKPIVTVDHILRDIEHINEVLDGELYAHGLSFQENMKLIKKYREGETEKVTYNVYDLIIDAPFIERYQLLCELCEGLDNVMIVPTYTINNEEELRHYHGVFLEQGYEGTMIRWGEEGYKCNGRSSNLLKYKDFIDITAKVIDVIPSEKRPEQGIVTARLEDGSTFNTGMKFSHAEREEILTNKSNYIGQTAEIRFFEYTDDGLPRFPVCVGFRLDK